MAEVVGGGVLDHAVLDVAALRRIVYRGFRGAVVHQPSNLPMSDETESPRRRRTDAVPQLDLDTAARPDRELPVESAIKSGYGFARPGSVSVAIWPSLALLCTTRNRVAVADSTPNDGEAPVIVGMADAAMHMYSAAIDALPDAQRPRVRPPRRHHPCRAPQTPGLTVGSGGPQPGHPVGHRRAQWCAAPLRRADGDRRRTAPAPRSVSGFTSPAATPSCPPRKRPTVWVCVRTSSRPSRRRNPPPKTRPAGSKT